MEAHEAAKLITMLVTAFPDDMRFLDGAQQTATRALYREFLADLPYAAGDAAVRRLIATSKRLPRIAELRVAISIYLHGRAMAGGEAWGEIRRLAEKYGAHRTPRPDWTISGGRRLDSEPTVMAVIDAIGWRVICLSEDQTADRARAIELYEQLASRVSVDRAVGVIAPPIPQQRLAAGDPLVLGGILSKLLPKGSP